MKHLRAYRIWFAGCALVVLLVLCTGSGVAWALLRPSSPRSAPPQVRIQAPAPGQLARVQEALSVQALAQARVQGAQVARLLFWVDGQLMGEQPGPANPLTGTWDWTPQEPGAHTLVVQAVDTQQGVAAAFRSVEVLGPGGASDTDGDRVADNQDACPQEPGVPQEAGCPEVGPDRDGDGVTDALDACPDQAGLEEHEGCPAVTAEDGDGDGIPNANDACPEAAGPVNTQGCPLPPDADGDGIPDVDDPCPETFAPEGGCPPAPDEDGDGVPNDQDACPEDPGAPGNNGCPLVDTDGDGIDDGSDACPEDPGPPENGGCPASSPEDGDGDGVADTEDACPNQPGAPENAGCPWEDADGDGVPDDQDACPDQVGPPGSDGCPHPDGDGDGVPDDQDSCPDLPGPQDNEGCPLTDNDGDGVPNEQDACPEMAGIDENQGCPPWVIGMGMVEVTEQMPRLCQLVPVVCNMHRDTDGDGIPDGADMCPDRFGTPLFQGCPWEDLPPPGPCPPGLPEWLCPFVASQEEVPSEGGGEPLSQVGIKVETVETNAQWAHLECGGRIPEVDPDWRGIPVQPLQENAWRVEDLSLVLPADTLSGTAFTLEFMCWGWRDVSEGTVDLGAIIRVHPWDQLPHTPTLYRVSSQGGEGDYLFWLHYQLCPNAECP